MDKRTINRIGHRYGKLTVIEYLGRDKNKSKTAQIRWKCMCDCGKIHNSSSHALSTGRAKSCGCNRKEVDDLKRFKNGEANLNRLFLTYISGAKRRNYKWELEKQDFKKLTKQNCFYCNIEPVQILANGRGYEDYLYNGIDRIDNSLGYTKDNCVSCCKLCNRSKSTLSYKEFINWIESVYNHIKFKEK
jgi:hypothetical protein